MPFGDSVMFMCSFRGWASDLIGAPGERPQGDAVNGARHSSSFLEPPKYVNQWPSRPFLVALAIILHRFVVRFTVDSQSWNIDLG